jgi:hypothetical protein
MPIAGESAISFLLRVAADVPTKSVRDLALVFFSVRVHNPRMRTDSVTSVDSQFAWLSLRMQGGRVEINDTHTRAPKRRLAHGEHSEHNKRSRTSSKQQRLGRDSPRTPISSSQKLITINALLNSNNALLQRIRAVVDPTSKSKLMAQFCINFNTAFGLYARHSL